MDSYLKYYYSSLEILLVFKLMYLYSFENSFWYRYIIELVLCSTRTDM